MTDDNEVVLDEASADRLIEKMVTRMSEKERAEASRKQEAPPGLSRQSPDGTYEKIPTVTPVEATATPESEEELTEAVLDELPRSPRLGFGEIFKEVFPIPPVSQESVQLEADRRRLVDERLRQVTERHKKKT